jgi:hypothetical protein
MNWPGAFIGNLSPCPKSYDLEPLVDLLVKASWDGWALMEREDKGADRVAGLTEQRLLWEKMIERAS